MTSTTVRVLLAVDKFKGSLGAPEVCAQLTAGLLDGDPALVVEAVPVADGGEGTLDAAVRAGFVPHTVSVTGPTGLPTTARLAVRGGTALVEMAQASGLALLPGGVPAPLVATSRGTGELVRAALDLGCTEIVLAVGGSASTDGGAGLLQALGVELRDADDRPLGPGGAALARLATATTDGLDPRLARTQVTLASDVDHPLLGPRGAAAVFGPQKGATSDDVRVLDACLARLVDVLADTLGPAVRTAAELPGAGAAGGTGFAALAVLGARRVSGIDMVQALTGLVDKVRRADLVVTGEGSLDAQTLGGKAVLGIARAAREAGVPVVAVCGVSTLTAEQVVAAGIDAVYPLSDLEPDPARSMSEAAALVRRVGEGIAHRLRP